MKWFMAILVVGVLIAFGFQSSSQSMSSAMMHETTAATYEQLATAIIAVRDTETNLVKGILTHSYAVAQRECRAALDVGTRGRVAHLEAAAREITNIASEGDRRIQAVRQRLLEAGHHHHTDAETDEDYIFIDSAEKKTLLELATRVARLGANASDDDIRTAMDDLTAAYDAALTEE